jgi:hypothetical protein
MGRKIIIILITLCIQGCAEFEFHVRKNDGKAKSPVILLCLFEVRNMNYDPYLSAEFTDLLKYELFSRGRDCIVMHKNMSSADNESVWASKICAENSGNILIRGVISRRETGFFPDRKVSSVITFTVYDRNGKIIGEGFYQDDQDTGGNSFMKDAARKFVTSLLENLDRVK